MKTRNIDDLIKELEDMKKEIESTLNSLND